MTFTAHSIHTKQGTLHYQKHGSGEKPLLVFHGFGQSAFTFQFLSSAAVGQTHTLYLFDLFFHGDSVWALEETALEKSVWKNLMELFFQQESVSRFSVLGFSMGGKFALSTVESFPDRVAKIYLLAPDGIKTSFWYSMATFPHALRHLFKSMITHPKRFHRLVTGAHAIGLIDKGILRFVEYQMNTEEKRRRVYNSWVVFRHLKFDLQKIANVINQYAPELVFIVGKHDKIITASSMNRLLKKVNNYQLEILEAGHNDLIHKSVPYLK